MAFLYSLISMGIKTLMCCRKNTVKMSENVNGDGRGGSHMHHEDASANPRESKLELFGFDSLVNILGLKRYVDMLDLVN